MDEYDEYDDISITFALNAYGIDDIPVICEWNKQAWEQILIEVSLVAPGTYNFENASVEFLIASGGVVEDIPVIFSIMRMAQNFASYVMQKTYCVTTEINGRVDQSLSDWNVSPNQLWYVSVSGTAVSLFETEADMLADTNIVASGIADTNLEVILIVNDEYDTEQMPLYYQDVLYHLKISASVTGVCYYKIKPFTDMYEIRHPIYNNSNIVISRGEAELNLHTHAILSRELVLGVHIPTAEVGEVVTFTSVRRNMEEKSQILSHTISGEVSDDGSASLTNTIQVANYRELYRQ